jgi:hypothetical protein
MARHDPKMMPTPKKKVVPENYPGVTKMLPNMTDEEKLVVAIVLAAAVKDIDMQRFRDHQAPPVLTALEEIRGLFPNLTAMDSPSDPV